MIGPSRGRFFCMHVKICTISAKSFAKQPIKINMRPPLLVPDGQPAGCSLTLLENLFGTIARHDDLACRIKLATGGIAMDYHRWSRRRLGLLFGYFALLGGILL